MSNKKVEPVKVEATDVTPHQTLVDIPVGRVFIVPIKNGKEHPELGFWQSAVSAEKHYATKPDKYALKKNHSI